MSRLVIPCLAALSFTTAAQAAPIAFANNGFEAPNLGAGSEAYKYPGHGGNPTLADQGGTGWTFVGGAGITANGSAFGTANGDNTNSTGGTSTSGQAGLLQGGDATTNGATAVTIAQALSGFQAGTATLTFKAEGRNGQNGSNPFHVQLDGQTFTFSAVPATATLTGGTVITPTRGTTFETYVSDPLTVTAGAHTLTFVGHGIPGQDVTTFIDSVSLENAVPEPSAIATLVTAALATLRRRRRKRA